VEARNGLVAIMSNEVIRRIVKKLERLPLDSLLAYEEELKAREEDAEVQKQRLLEHLRTRACVELRASKIAGVGVFAYRDIEEGMDPFASPNPGPEPPLCTLSGAEVNSLPHETQLRIKSFFAPMTDEDGWESSRGEDGELEYGITASGMEKMDLSWYVNHECNPSLRTVEPEPGGFSHFVTARKIAAGEELTVDYRELGEGFYSLVDPIDPRCAAHGNALKASQLQKS
jgi:hypothetical protein